MAYWRDYIRVFEQKVDSSGLTESQVINATDAKLKSFLSIDAAELEEIRIRLPRIKGYAASYARRRDKAAEFAKIISKLTSANLEFLKAMDKEELSERLNK